MASAMQINSLYDELKGVSVLVVDDDKDLAEMLHEQLEEAGMKVVGVAYRGIQAIEMAGSLNPDLIVLDIELPDIDGIEVACTINETEPRPIMFLTAFSTATYINRAKKAGGVFTYLVKPVTLEQMAPSIVLTLDRFREMIELKAAVEDMRETISNQDVIEKAKLVLMHNYSLFDSDALVRLRLMSREQNKPLADVAQAIVNGNEEQGLPV